MFENVFRDLQIKLIFAQTTMRHLFKVYSEKNLSKKISANIRRLRELFPAQVPCIFFFSFSFPFIYFLFVCLFPYVDENFCLLVFMHLRVLK